MTAMKEFPDFPALIWEFLYFSTFPILNILCGLSMLRFAKVSEYIGSDSINIVMPG